MNGEDIKRVREKANISQDKLREALGLGHRCTLVDIELGRVDVTESFVYRALGVIAGIVAEREGKAVRTSEVA